MRICIPVSEYRGLDSPVHGHFGSAPGFALVDGDSMAVEFLPNRDEQHTHGACSPLQAIAGHAVDVILVGGIGAGALQGLRQAGIAVRRAPPGNVAEAVHACLEGRAPEIAAEHTCAGHGHGCQLH